MSSLWETTNQALPLHHKDLVSGACGATCSSIRNTSVPQPRFLLHNCECGHSIPFPWRSRVDLSLSLRAHIVSGFTTPRTGPKFHPSAALVSPTRSVCVCRAVTAVSHWWPQPRSGPGLWFQSSMHTCHMDNPAVTCLLDYRGLELEVHMEIFFCVLPNVLF